MITDNRNILETGTWDKNNIQVENGWSVVKNVLKII